MSVPGQGTSFSLATPSHEQFARRLSIICDEPPEVFFGGVDEPRIRAFLASILK